MRAMPPRQPSGASGTHCCSERPRTQRLQHRLEVHDIVPPEGEAGEVRRGRRRHLGLDDADDLATKRRSLHLAQTHLDGE